MIFVQHYAQVVEDFGKLFRAGGVTIGCVASSS